MRIPRPTSSIPKRNHLNNTPPYATYDGYHLWPSQSSSSTLPTTAVNANPIGFTISVSVPPVVPVNAAVGIYLIVPVKPGQGTAIVLTATVPLTVVISARDAGIAVVDATVTPSTTVFCNPPGVLNG